MFCLPDILRLLGIFGHCDRMRQAVGLRIGDQFCASVSLGIAGRVLATLAYLADELVERLRLFSTWRSEAIAGAEGLECAVHIFTQRAVAWCFVELYPLGCHQRNGSFARSR